MLRAVHTSGDVGMTLKVCLPSGLFPTWPGAAVWDWPMVTQLERGKVVTPRA